MNTKTTSGRLQALKRSLEAARDADHPHVDALPTSVRALHQQYLRGLADGVQFAIDAIDGELMLIAAGERAAAAHAQPE